MKKRFVWLIPGGFSCESLKALVTHPISMWHMMIDIGWQIPILFETPRYQCLWSTNKPWKSHHVWWPGFSCHTGALQACHLHNSAQNIEAQSPSHLLREYSWAAQWDAQLTKSEHSTHQRLNDMGIHNVYAQCLQKVPNIGHIYIYSIYVQSVYAYIMFAMGQFVGLFFMEFLDDLSTSNDLLRGSILPRRPCAWLAPCHRTTRSTSTGPRAASAARCGRSCLNDFWLEDEGTHHTKEKTGKNWSSFGIGKSISV